MKGSLPGKEVSCPVCGAPDMSPFFEMPEVPVFCNVLCSSRQEALQVLQGRIALALCERCGFIANLAFDPEKVKYSPQYENALHFSPRFQEYAESLARRLIDRYDLRGKTVIEIACGDGTFLRRLCELGVSRGIGFDPSYEPERAGQASDDAVEIIRDYYSQRYGDRPADLICCRHALEHIPAPLDFLRMIRRSLDPARKPILYFEVPNMLYTLRDLGIWDIIYEHCCYFVPESLAVCFESAGFEVLEVREDYGGQFLALEATACEKAPAARRASLEPLAEAVKRFAGEYERKAGHWQRRLEAMKSEGQRAVVWGSGSKGVTFLNVLKEGSPIEYIVDINPRKQGQFVVGTGQEIVPPEFLQEYRPEFIILMNPIYRGEIERQAQDLGIKAKILVA